MADKPVPTVDAGSIDNLRQEAVATLLDKRRALVVDDKQFNLFRENESHLRGAIKNLTGLIRDVMFTPEFLQHEKDYRSRATDDEWPKGKEIFVTKPWQGFDDDFTVLAERYRKNDHIHALLCGDQGPVTALSSALHAMEKRDYFGILDSSQLLVKRANVWKGHFGGSFHTGFGFARESLNKQSITPKACWPIWADYVDKWLEANTDTIPQVKREAITDALATYRAELDKFLAYVDFADENLKKLEASRIAGESALRPGGPG